MSYRTMMDTVGSTARNIPSSCRLVAAYITGTPEIAWTQAQIAAAASHAEVVAIAQDNSNDARLAYRTLILDVEPGAYTDEVAASVAAQRDAKGFRTTLYIDQAGHQTLREAIPGLLGSIDWWVADWNLNEAEAAAQLGSGVVAVQWASPTSNPNTSVPGGSGTLASSNIDLSVAVESGWPTLPPPVETVWNAQVAVIVDGPRAGTWLPVKPLPLTHQ